MVRTKKVCLVFTALSLMFGTFTNISQARPWQACTVAPEGFDDVKTYIGAGRYVDSSVVENGPSECAGGFCNGEYFHRQVMNRSDVDIDDLEQLAAEFYLERFGIGVEDPANAGRISFDRFGLDPRIGLTNFQAAGECVPRNGWAVADGGWVVLITDVAGYTLGGDWEGFHVPKGTALFFGNYLITKTNRRGAVIEKQAIYYRSRGPVIFEPLGEASFRCELAYDGQDFPTGVHGTAEGIVASYTDDTGELKWNMRHVLTFNDSEGL